MKNFKFLPLIFFSIFLVQCDDNTTNVLQKAEKKFLEKSDAALKPCANNSFAYPDEATLIFGIIYCSGDPEVDITGRTNSTLWSNLVGNGSRLGFLACGHSGYDGPPCVNNFQNVTTGNHPEFEWDFKWSHEFKVQKKVNGGNWTTIGTITKQLDQYDTRTWYFEDTSVNLSSLQGNLEYRVLNCIFDMYEPSCTTFTFEGTPIPLSVTIDGPIEVLNPQKGNPPLIVTWTPDIEGGVTPFAYDWYYKGILTSHNSSYSLTFPYAAGQSDSYFSLRLVVTDSNDVTAEDIIQVFVDYPPYEE